MSICSVDGCSLPIRSKGMCKNHRQRLLKYGRVEIIVTGEKTKHPLYGMWNKRRQQKGAFSWEWLDFDTFTEDVGEKPEDHFLARLDESKPCGPTNFEWRKVKVKKLLNETDHAYRLRQQARYRLENPLAGRKANYKVSFNLTLEEFELKLKAQNYVCAICGEPETAVYKNTNLIRNLAVDHCHTTGKIRDLLCSKCNNILGRIKESKEILNSMLKYLEKHSSQ